MQRKFEEVGFHVGNGTYGLFAGEAEWDVHGGIVAIADRTRPKRPPVPELPAQVLEHVPEHELASGYDTRPASLRVEETDAAFITDDAPAAGGKEERFGALAAWTDSRVKHQTELTAFGLLAVAALAVILVFFH